ncbi:MAG TPA: cyclopropane-fatty-acyl-phospholipid synthase family protein [Vicinamibacterales bacterium]|nr:cyclopropane-fatty-acyl-phospholipid synthase family protein [Vicinamibacterales bacterium]
MSNGLLLPERAGWSLARDVPSAATPAVITWVDRFIGDRLQRLLEPVGLRFELWDGSSIWPSDVSPVATITARNRRALFGMAFNPDLRFGEDYMSARLEVEGDLERVAEAISRLPASERLSLREWLALRFPHANTRRAAAGNVHHHYDLGNDFYRLWLDDQLVYTCAYFPQRGATLEDAQVAKMDLVCRKLRLQPGERVLEAGCGWGALALHMARSYGVRVTAYNISREQLAYARDRAAREGLADRVEFLEGDYRTAAGTFDVFVSVGMLEHVGRRHYPTLADVIRRTLHPAHGRGLLHFIGRDRPRPLNAWIRRRIFPGAHPPALSELQRPVFERADLTVHDVENLRLHYAQTLHHWRTRFESAERQVKDLFGEPFFRAWHLYLAGSEAAFVTGTLQLFQVVFAPATATPPYWTRRDAFGTVPPRPSGGDTEAACSAATF